MDLSPSCQPEKCHFSEGYSKSLQACKSSSGWILDS